MHVQSPIFAAISLVRNHFNVRDTGARKFAILGLVGSVSFKADRGVLVGKSFTKKWHVMP